MRPRILEVRQDVLKKNDLLARGLRERFSSAAIRRQPSLEPRAGETARLEATLRDLQPEHRVAALVCGDLATDRRPAPQPLGTRVRQITNGTVCHLNVDAELRSGGLTWGRSTSCSLRTSATWCARRVVIWRAPAGRPPLGDGGEVKPLKYLTIFKGRTSR